MTAPAERIGNGALPGAINSTTTTKGDNNMTYRIRCRVSGGVTGTREGWLKDAKGEIAQFDTREAAQAEADANTNRTMGNPYRTAHFTYTVEDL